MPKDQTASRLLLDREELEVLPDQAMVAPLRLLLDPLMLRQLLPEPPLTSTHGTT